MEEILRINGSYGEGGGQILRTSLSLSIVTGKPFEIFDIRKGRKNPGLQPQHLTCVRAARDISSATVQGDFLGSASLQFFPRKIASGKYHFNVAEERGSAGSATLVLQTLLLPLSLAEQESEITIEGGTHVPWSPPFHFISETFSRMVMPLGFSFSFSIEKWGWYPRGGGSIRARVFPRKKNVPPFALKERGRLTKIPGISAVSNLPLSIAERQRDEARRLLSEKGLKTDIAIVDAPAIGPGTFIFLNAVFENGAAGFSALGRKGKRAEEVASEAVAELLRFLESDAAMDPCLADQIVLYLPMTEGDYSFETSRVTKHLLTNLWAMRKFLPTLEADIAGEEGKPGKLILKGQ